MPQHQHRDTPAPHRRPPDAAPLRIGHISDFHLPLPRSVPWHRLFSKRVLGLANLTWHRRHTHALRPFERILDALQQEAPDITVITGDLVNLALDFEFDAVAARLRDAGFTRDNTLLVPGNHDRYTPFAHLRGDFEARLSDWFPPPPSTGKHPRYPLVRPLGPAVFIGLDTATWRGPLRAAGVLRTSQLDALHQALVGPFADKHPVVALHHPPFALEGALGKQYRDGMAHGERLLDILAGRNATVLHGHTHLRSFRRLGDTAVFGVPSTSSLHPDDRRTAAYHLYEVTAQGLRSATSVQYIPGAPAGADFRRIPWSPNDEAFA
ncbi:MAG: metallophosphoesterase [Myxococcales bacterium]|nr:metallophosphoesterase [Myxococcales bacterium]